MIWADAILAGGILLSLCMAKHAATALKEEATPDNDTLADELEQLDERLARQRARLRELRRGHL